jgi:IclR family pca regulon transcriptional regulator
MRKSSASARGEPARTSRGPGHAAQHVATQAEEIQALAGDPNFMTSLARGLAVVRAFSQQRQRLSIAQISLRTGISRAAVRRCLYTLARLGYVASDDGRNFTLRPRILALGHAYLSSAPLVSSAQPLLDHVSDQVHESCSMAIHDGDDILYVARSSSSARIMSIDLGIGSRLPAFCTSMGRVLLAGLPAGELNDFLKRFAPTPYTARTLVVRDRLRDAIAAARQAGYAIVDQELELGLRSIAVPVVDANGQAAAAINISTQAARVPIADIEKRYLPVLRAAASELSLLLS